MRKLKLLALTSAACIALTGMQTALPDTVLMKPYPVYAAEETPEELVSGIFKYTVSDGTVTITGLTESPEGVLTIPGTIDGKPVTAIGNAAFQYRSAITSFVFPDSITSIGYSAFESCKGLTEVTLPAKLHKLSVTAVPVLLRLGSRFRELGLRRAFARGLPFGEGL